MLEPVFRRAFGNNLGEKTITSVNYKIKTSIVGKEYRNICILIKGLKWFYKVVQTATK